MQFQKKLFLEILYYELHIQIHLINEYIELHHKF